MIPRRIRSRLGVRPTACILPVDPLDVMAGKIGTHGFPERCKEGLLAEALEKFEAIELAFTGSFISAKHNSIPAVCSVSSSSQIASAAVTSTLVTGSVRYRRR